MQITRKQIEKMRNSTLTKAGKNALYPPHLSPGATQ